MLDQRKIKLRTRVEAVRSEEPGNAFKISSHSKGGYVARGMLKSLIGITGAFVLVIFLIILVTRYDRQSYNIASSGGSLIIYTVVYAVLAAIYLLISFFVYRRRYDRAVKRVDEFSAYMDSLDEKQE